MKTYNIELPAEFRSGNSVPVAVATIKRERMEEILREAIEAARMKYGRNEGDSRQRMGEPVNRTDWNAELASWSDEDFVQVFHEHPDLADRLRKVLAEPMEVPSDDVLADALSNLEHDNYERSYSGYKDRQADIGLIRAAIEADRKRKQSEAEEVCAEAYQVVGSLLSDLGIFETDAAEKILDNLSQARMVHKDVLPWPSFDCQRRGEPVAWMVPSLHTFKNCEYTNCPPEIQVKLEGTVAWSPSIIEDMPPVTDKHGVTHHPRPLVYGDEAPQPAEPVNSEFEAMHGDQWQKGFASACRYLGGKAEPVEVTLDFDQIGCVGPFPIVNGRVHVPAVTTLDLVRMAQPAEPVKVPSDAQIMAEVYAVCPDFDSAHEGIDEDQVVSAFRALLARYGHQDVWDRVALGLRQVSSDPLPTGEWLKLQAYIKVWEDGRIAAMHCHLELDPTFNPANTTENDGE